MTTAWKTTTQTQTKEENAENPEFLEKLIAPQARPWNYEIIYGRIVSYAVIHIAAIYGLYLCIISAKWATIILRRSLVWDGTCVDTLAPSHVQATSTRVGAAAESAERAKWRKYAALDFLVYMMAQVGVTAGAHRLWSHRSYKAKMPLQIILMLFNSMAFQYPASNWVRDHRLHHRHSDTDADPHNASRGFFFAHIGSQFVKKHPEVARRGKFTDLADVKANPVLRFQDKYYVPLVGVFCFLLPTVIPVYFWGESLSNAWYVNMFRFIVNIHVTMSINSFAHLYGTRPYDKGIMPTQNSMVSIASMGEGFHNYHHVFPWDYSAGELGNNWLNMSTKFIDFFAWIGWAYDLKRVPEQMVQARSARTGDGCNTWGWPSETSNMYDEKLKYNLQ